MLSSDPETVPLVVPHLDTHAAAEQICCLAQDRRWLEDMRYAVARVAQTKYDTATYVEHLDKMGCQANAALRAEDLRLLVESEAIDADLALAPGATPAGVYGVERQVLVLWHDGTYVTADERLVHALANSELAQVIRALDG